MQNAEQELGVGRAREAMICFMLGVKDALSLRAILTSMALWVACVALLLVVFWLCREHLHYLSSRIAEIVRGPAVVLDLMSSSSGIVGRMGATMAASSGKVVGWLSVVALFIFGVIVLVRILSELFLMKRIQKQVLQAYPASLCISSGAGHGHDSSRWQEWCNTWGLLLLTPFCLVVPLIGPLILFLALSYLNARFLVNDALAGVVGQSDAGVLSSGLRAELLMVGQLSALASMVPVLGVLVPWATGSAVCHLTMRRLVDQADARCVRLCSGGAQ